MFILRKSRIESVGNGKVRLVTPVTETVDGKSTTHDIWVEVGSEHEKYLCSERADAILLGVLHYALKHGHDIQSEMPVSRELFFNVTNLLIPALSAGSKSVYRKISVQAEITSEAVAQHWSRRNRHIAWS